MKLNTILWGTLGVILVSAPAVMAQSATAPSSEPQKAVPVRLRAPEKARWLITLNPRKSVEEASGGDTGEGAETAGGKKRLPFQQRTQVTKQGSVIFEQVYFGDGKRHEKWCVGDLQYPVIVGAKGDSAVAYTKTSFSSTPDPMLFTDYSASDFPGAEWLSGKSPVGRKKVMGRECLVFSEGDKSAYVDVENLYPLVLQASGQTWVIEFQPTPQGSLSLPPAIAKDQEKRAEVQKMLDARAAAAGIR